MSFFGSLGRAIGRGIPGMTPGRSAAGGNDLRSLFMKRAQQPQAGMEPTDAGADYGSPGSAMVGPGSSAGGAAIAGGNDLRSLLMARTSQPQAGALPPGGGIEAGQVDSLPAEMSPNEGSYGGAAIGPGIGQGVYGPKFPDRPQFTEANRGIDWEWGPRPQAGVLPGEGYSTTMDMIKRPIGPSNTPAGVDAARAMIPQDGSPYAAGSPAGFGRSLPGQGSGIARMLAMMRQRPLVRRSY